MWLVSDTFRGATGYAPPTGCLSHWPSPGTASATGRRNARPALLGCSSGRYHNAPERPRASPSPAAGDEQIAPRRLVGHDTGQSDGTAGHTTPATPRPSVGPWPYGRAVAAQRAPTSHRRQVQGWGAPPSPAPFG